MKLLSLEYFDDEQKWGFEKIEFFDLTLLVGVSGVGKTQILQSIFNLKDIANGSNSRGVSWNVKFESTNGKTYTWTGQFENIEDKQTIFDELFNNGNKIIKPKITNETLTTNNKTIINRTPDIFNFNGNEMPKLNPSESAIYILKEEESIKEIYDSFKLIIYRDHTQKEGIKFSNFNIEKLKLKFDSFEKIKESDLDTFTKLALIYYVSNETFLEIIDRFIDVFPQVEDIKVEPIRDNEFSNFILETTIIQIKEKKVDTWIPHNRMSSGMLRTLLHIAEMYLWNEGTVVLIDEFENSLGLNCINVLTEDILYENNSIQFIATSHHPYIINKIPSEFWKIVNRNGSMIKTIDAKQFDLGKSHHDSFLSLINNPIYKKGIL